MSETKRIPLSRLTTMDSTDKQLEIFRILYPIFKDEIFKRREQMIRLTAFSSTLLVLTLVTLLPITPWETAHSLTLWLSISGVALFSALFAYFILQHAERHRMAKRQLIELEKDIGLYDNDWQTNKAARFPNNWQTDWITDQSVSIYLTILITLTILVICAMLIRV